MVAWGGVRHVIAIEGQACSERGCKWVREGERMLYV